MHASSKQERERIVKQSLANSAIEGFEPDMEYLALLDRYINGELSIEQIMAHTDAGFGATGTHNSANK